MAATVWLAACEGSPPASTQRGLSAKASRDGGAADSDSTGARGKPVALADMPAAGPPASLARGLEELRTARADLPPAVYARQRGNQDASVERPVPGYGREGLMVSRGDSGRLRRLSGLPYLVEVPGASPDASATGRCRAFLQRWGKLWGMGAPGMKLVHQETKHDDAGNHHCIFGQQYRGVPIDRLEFVVHLDAEGRVTSVNGDYLPEVRPSPRPDVSSAQAVAAAQAKRRGSTAGQPELVVLSPAQFNRRGGARLAWRVRREEPQKLMETWVWIDAHSGQVLYEEPAVASSHVREVWNAQFTTSGQNLRFRSQPLVNNNCGILSGNRCSLMNGLQISVNQMWQDQFARDSFDDDGGLMKTLFNYKTTNCGVGGLHFDDGRIAITGAASALGTESDVVAHEYGHALEQAETGVGIKRKRGAIGEHFADIHAFWLSQRLGSRDGTIDLCNNIGFLRSLSNPPAAGDPDSWRWYKTMKNGADDGGVHTNNGILNKLAQLLHQSFVSVETHHDVPVPGVSFADARQLSFNAVNNHFFTSGSDFHEYRNGVVAACDARFDIASLTCAGLNAAWNAAGLWSPQRSIALRNGIGSRPEAVMWQDIFGQRWLYVFYKEQGGHDIVWQRVNPQTQTWSPQSTVHVGDFVPQTDGPVSVVPVQVNPLVGFLGERLEIFYKDANSQAIESVRMRADTVDDDLRDETFENRAQIPTSLARTDRAPAAVSTPNLNAVLFKAAGSKQTRLVQRQNAPVGTWQMGPTPPLRTNKAPHMTEWTTNSNFIGMAAVKQGDAKRMDYAWFTGNGWGSFEEPNCGPTRPGEPIDLSTDRKTGAGDANPRFSADTDNNGGMGHRQANCGAPNKGWRYSLPTTERGPTITEWKRDFLLVHKGKDTNRQFMHVFGQPLWGGSGTDFVWGPQVEQPVRSNRTSVLVKVDSRFADDDRSLWMLSREPDGVGITWRTSRGGQ